MARRPVALDPPASWAGIAPAEAARAFYDTLPNYGFDLDKAKAELAQSTLRQRLRHLGAGPDRADPYMLDISAKQLSQATCGRSGSTCRCSRSNDETWRAGYLRHGENLGMQIIAQRSRSPRSGD